MSTGGREITYMEVLESENTALRKLVAEYKKRGASVRREHGFLDDCICDRCKALRVLEKEG